MFCSQFIDAHTCANNYFDVKTFDKVITKIKQRKFFASVYPSCLDYLAVNARRSDGDCLIIPEAR